MHLKNSHANELATVEAQFWHVHVRACVCARVRACMHDFACVLFEDIISKFPWIS